MNISTGGKKKPCRHVDGGYGWVIVCCSFILQGISAGLSLSVGVFYVEWLSYFGESQGSTAWIGSINTGLLFGCGVIVSLCIERINGRYVAFFGGVCSAVGLFASAHCQQLWQLYLTYGVITGAGLSSIYIPASVICGEYFNRLRPLAMGIAAGGVGLFCLIIPISTELLIQHYGWRGAMIIMSGMSVQSCLFSYMLFPISFWSGYEMVKQANGSDSKTCEKKPPDSTLRKSIWAKLDLSMVLDIKFVLFSINNVLWNAASLITLVFIAEYALVNGIPSELGALLISIIGLCSLIGRVGSGIVGYLLHIKHLWLFNFATLLTVFGIAGLPLFASFHMLAVLCVFYGVGFGGQIGVLGITLIELFGVHKLTSSFGYIMVAHGIGALCGPPLGGILFEKTQSYHVLFYFAAGISFFAVLIVVLIQIIQRKKATNMDHSITEDTENVVTAKAI